MLAKVVHQDIPNKEVTAAISKESHLNCRLLDDRLGAKQRSAKADAIVSKVV